MMSKSTGQLFSNGIGRIALSQSWFGAKDGDDGAREFFDRHYSRIKYRDGRRRKLFVGPGKKLVMVTEPGDALFIWRKFKDDSGQQGVNCAVFRNEGPVVSSDLIREADTIAFAKWPGERHYTYVKASAIRSSNPGYCFIKAGWKRCGITKWNKLVILELPAPQPLSPDDERR